MRIGIIGSRRRTDKQSIIDFVATLSPGDIIISGGCTGPDLWAEQAAKDKGLKTIIFMPLKPAQNAPRYEFTKAYYERNLRIAQNSDIIHAFPAIDRKGGTENTIKQAEKLGVPIIIHPAK